MKTFNQNIKLKQVAAKSLLNLIIPETGYYQKDELAETELNQACFGGLLQVLLDMGLETKQGEGLPIHLLRAALGIEEKYDRLFKEMIRSLVAADYLRKQGPKLYRTNISINSKIVDTPHFTLLNLCLSSMKEILTGKVRATDIIFPGGSLEFVSAIYTGNKLADYFNELISGVIVETVGEAIKKLNTGEKIKILEVGAGTGGTSAVLFEKLAAYKDYLLYSYTDVSRSFLIQAEENFKSIAPYIETSLFDIEQSPLNQELEIGAYDLVIGANVVHATKDIAATLTNIKAVLKKNGLLILNELARTEIFSTLTFGLLDGWWMYEDVELRLSGSPALSSESWEAVLSETGFEDVAFSPSNSLSQQIIMARSNGMVTIDLQPIKPEQIERTGKKEINSSWLTSKLAAIAADTIKLPVQRLNHEKQFVEMGFDSILGTTLLKNINKELNITLSPTDIFNYPNIIALSKYIEENFSGEIEGIGQNEATSNADALTSPFVQHGRGSGLEREGELDMDKDVLPEQNALEFASEKEVTNTLKNQISHSKNCDVAIVGMSCQFGAANNLDEFWKALAEGTSFIESVPEGKWKANGSAERWGSFLKNVDLFDPMFFKISGGEAETMDPQQRLFLQHCWMAIEDAAINPETLKTKKCGVYVGAGGSDYIENFDGVPASAFWGNSSSILASRISYLLDLKGPAVSIDTACSSSLVAMELGYNSLLKGDTDLIITGGATVLSSDKFYSLAHKAGMLSPDGKCYTFDSRANGFVIGEGIGVVIMKRLEDAERDEDQIYGVIKGIMTNQDGTTNGITAPSAISQAELIKDLYVRVDINPETIGYVEAHGTGTQLGDPIEFQALTNAFKSFTNKKQFCGLGSVKTNIGHTLMAAGVAGIIKVMLAFKHKKLPPTINFRESNPLISFTDSPFKIQNGLTSWEPSERAPRRATVSSFGFSGTNAHVLLEDYKPKRKTSYRSISPAVIILSAKSESRLKEQAKNLYSYLKGHPEVDLHDIAFTLQVGREQMEERIAIVAKNIAELETQITGFLEGDTSGFFKGNTRKDQIDFLLSGTAGKAFVETAVREKDAASLAQLWVKGVKIDWTLLYSTNKPSKISLPTYPFAKEKYWIKKQTEIKKAFSLFTSNWKSFDLSIEEKRTGRILILSSGESKALIRQIEKSIGSVTVVSSKDFKLDVRNINGVIDLTPLENKTEQDNSWISILQQLIENGAVSKLLIVNNKVNGAKRFGLYQMLQAEYSKVESLHLEIADDLETDSLGNVIISAYNSKTGYSKLKYKDATWFHPNLKETDKETITPIEIEGPILITGGTRGIGMLCAKHLVDQFKVKKLVLLGKEEMPARNLWESISKENSAIGKKITNILYLEGKGTSVKVLNTSLIDREALTEALSKVKEEWGSIKGLLHCAGSINISSPAFVRKNIHKMEELQAPKTTGLANLHKVLLDHNPHFSILFSSVSSLIPRLGVSQSDYVMANTFMDYFASYQRANGYNYTSIQWPSWKETGMGEVKGGVYEDLGLYSITNSEGLSVLDKVLSGKSPAVIFPASYDPEKFDLDTLLTIPRQDQPTKVTAVQAKVTTSATDWLTTIVSEELKLPKESLDIDVPFQEFGVDSIILAQMIKRIEQELEDVDLSPTVILENPTIGMLGDYMTNNFPLQLSKVLQEKVEKSADDAKIFSKPGFLELVELPKSNIASSKKSASSKIAVVGMACHFPDARNTAEFWENLKVGKDSIKEVPGSRWNVEKHFGTGPRKSVSKWGGYLNNIEDFDPKYFGINAETAKYIDPLQRQWLEVSAEAIADAGYKKEELWGKRVGVYAGSRTSTFSDKIKDLPKDVIVGIGQNFISAHLAHIYNFKGPNLVVDTACSSSLTAIHLAVKGLLSGETEMALAGGVDILLDEKLFITLSTAGVLSPDGRSKTFDEKANGTGIGEGCGVLVLKRFEDAIEAGNKIYGVIEGTSINNDGNTMGVTTPNPEAQFTLMQDAVAVADIDPSTITYVETHGTGTLIGDPIELKAITRLLNSSNRPSFKCAVGSVKSNVGHLLSAAGVAGVIKTLLAINAKMLPPTLHCDTPNRRFDFATSPVFPVTELSEWTGVEGVRRAGVSAFGLGGNNAHIIISNEGIPKERSVEMPLSLPNIKFNRSRYWPEEQPKPVEKEKNNTDDSFSKYLNFLTN